MYGSYCLLWNISNLMFIEHFFFNSGSALFLVVLILLNMVFNLMRCCTVFSVPWYCDNCPIAVIGRTLLIWEHCVSDYSSLSRLAVLVIWVLLVMQSPSSTTRAGVFLLSLWMLLVVLVSIFQLS